MKEFKSKLIGKRAYIKDDIESWAAGEWGIIKYYDGDYYHIAIWNGETQPIFSRNEFVVPRDQTDPAERYRLPQLTTDNLTEDELHNFTDLTDNEQERLLDPTVVLDEKVDILTIHSMNRLWCYLCKGECFTKQHLRTHVKVHLSKMGALKFLEFKRKI